jgi:hypothetical protein
MACQVSEGVWQGQPAPSERELPPLMPEPILRAELARLWPLATKEALKPVWVEAMVEAHAAMRLSPHALVAGFAHAVKSGKLR